MSGDPHTDLPAHPAQTMNPELELPADPAQPDPAPLSRTAPPGAPIPGRGGAAWRRGGRAAHVPRREDSGTVRAPGESALIAPLRDASHGVRAWPRQGWGDAVRAARDRNPHSGAAERAVLLFSGSLASDVGKKRRAQERQLERFAV